MNRSKEEARRLSVEVRSSGGPLSRVFGSTVAAEYIPEAAEAQCGALFDRGDRNYRGRMAMQAFPRSSVYECGFIYKLERSTILQEIPFLAYYPASEGQRRRVNSFLKYVRLMFGSICPVKPQGLYEYRLHYAIVAT